MMSAMRIFLVRLVMGCGRNGTAEHFSNFAISACPSGTTDHSPGQGRNERRPGFASRSEIRRKLGALLASNLNRSASATRFC